ncbi:MAG: hypothetical protein IJO87_08940 [Eggerthellaceae bacterium]|nr:hypothetical protein [Eggerthellaceae bacterium]
MARVAPINLANNPRTLWFDPGDFEIAKDVAVVVETARGIEYGVAASDIIEVGDEEIQALKSPLKPVLRLATPEDAEFAREMEERSREALPVFKQMAAEAHPDMRPVSVEFLLDGDKAVFYFEAEDRIDFRELVRRLAAHFKVRIDMRQIGVRDEARMVGGLGHCGQELCCKRMGGEFCPVSIRMAKEQDLSLNPQKISGLCGRLMCCLRYEYDAYKDFKSRAPKMGATIQTPAGAAKVVELDVPREIVSLKVGDEKPVKVPLADFDEPAEAGARPTSVGVEAWDEATAEAVPGYGTEALTFLTSQFTGTDKLAEKGSVRHGSSSKGKRAAADPDAASNSRRSRRSRGLQSKAAEPAPETRKPRRRSTKIAAGEADSAVANQDVPVRRKPAAEAAEGAEVRSGRRSRSRSHQAKASVGTSSEAASRSQAAEGAERSESGKQKAPAKQTRSGRVKRERKQQAADSPREASGERTAQKASAKPSVRPGQKSSGLRAKPQERPEGAAEGKGAEGQGQAAQHRRPRRRRSQGAQGQGGNE